MIAWHRYNHAEPIRTGPPDHNTLYWVVYEDGRVGIAYYDDYVFELVVGYNEGAVRWWSRIDVPDVPVEPPSPPTQVRRTAPWVMPAEPGPEVTHVSDCHGRVWAHTDDPAAPWESGRVCTTWPGVLALGPLTDVSGITNPA